MKKFHTTLIFCSLVIATKAQPMHKIVDTNFIQQKSKTITKKNSLTIENIGFEVNSKYAELRPTISQDGNLLFFIRQNHPYNTKVGEIINSQDIWFSFKDSTTGKWNEAVHLGYPLNTTYYNAVFWISPDNNRLLIRNAFLNEAHVGNGVSMCHLDEEGNWTFPLMLRIKDYHKYDKGNTYGASMSNDGQTLFLYMSEEEGSAVNDIYICHLKKDGSWSEPRGLDKINHPDYNETTPFFSSDGETLYFSSDRPGGEGSLDIWMSKKMDKNWHRWSDPVNLKGPINSKDWNAFFTLDAVGDYAFTTSEENTYGQSDIVKVKLSAQEHPKPVLMWTGTVLDIITKQPVSASLLFESLPEGDQIGHGISNTADGTFKMVFPVKGNYSVHASAKNYFGISENLNLDSLDNKGYQEIQKNLYLTPIVIGQVVRLNNVFFEKNKWEMAAGSEFELSRVVQLLTENPRIEIDISAHTDSVGTDPENYILSDKRANSVLQFLVKKKIAPARITTHAYGERLPLVPEGSEADMRRNSRIELKIIRK